MSKCSMRFAALFGFAACTLAGGAATAQDVNPEDRTYVNCQHRFAVIFPDGSHPQIREVTHSSTEGRTVPAREFYLEQDGKRFSVTVVDFSQGPAAEESIVEHAAVAIRQRGEVRFQAQAPYDPGMPGRQLNVFEPNGRQHRASVYMADHRLFITEANAPQGDFSALQFEQSISLVDAMGGDLDRNAGQPPRMFICGTQ